MNRLQEVINKNKKNTKNTKNKNIHTSTVNMPLLGSSSKNVSVTLLRANSLGHYSRNLIGKLLCRQRFVDRSRTCKKGSGVCYYAA